MSAGRVAFKEHLHVLMQQAVHREALLEGIDLIGVGQLTVDQQIADVGESRLLGDLFDRVAAIPQDPLLAVDEGDRALARTGVAVPGIERDGAGLLAQGGDIEAHLALRTDHDRELQFVSFHRQLGVTHLFLPQPTRFCEDLSRCGRIDRRDWTR